MTLFTMNRLQGAAGARFVSMARHRKYEKEEHVLFFGAFVLFWWWWCGVSECFKSDFVLYVLH